MRARGRTGWGAALVIAVAGAALAAPAADAKTYRTPGYKGTRTVPNLQPPPLPPVVTVGQGRNPDVLVDEAGTAHIAFNEQVEGAADILRYCRVPRGATACDSTAAVAPTPPESAGSGARFSKDTEGPRVLAVGDDVALITRRYPAIDNHPDGQASDESVYMWISSDGGTTFTGPAIVGTSGPSGEAIAFGPPENPRIITVTDTETGGTWTQTLDPGRFTRSRAHLGTGDRAYFGRLTLDGGLPVATFSDLGRAIYVRRWSGNGDPNDAATWSEIGLPVGSDARPAGGPAGLHLLAPDGPVGSGSLNLFRLDGDRLGPPLRIPEAAGPWHVLAQDAGARLHAAWVREQTVRKMTLVGRTLGADIPLTADGQGIAKLDLETTFDGGGLTVFERGGPSSVSGNAPIQGAAFGPVTRTGRLGLGARSGGGLPPGTIVACTRVAFGDLDLRTREGCLLGAADGSGRRVSSGPLNLNGIEIIPDPGVRIVIDPRRRTIDSTGNVTMQVSAPSITPIVLFQGEIHLKIPARGAGGARNAQKGAGKRGTIVMGLDSEKYPTAVKGFPVTGEFSIEVLDDGSSKIKMSLELPKVFSGITGEVELLTDNKKGLSVDSLKVQSKSVPLGVVILEEFEIKYDGADDKWSSKIRLVLPPLPAGPKIGGTIVFKGGKFLEATLEAGPPFPGIKLAPAVFLTRIGGGFGIDPFTVIAKASLGAVPIAPPSKYTVGIDGEIRLSFGDPFTYALKGAGTLFDYKISEGYMTANTDGYMATGGKIEFDVDAVSIKGELDAFVDAGNSFRFGGRILGETCVVGVCLLRGEGVLSSRGIGACFTTGLTYGFGYKWGDSPLAVEIFGPFSCDVSDYTIPPPKKASAAQAGAPTFTVAGPTPVVNVRLRGDGGAPNVVLVSPTGERITPAEPAGAGADARAVVLRTPGGRAYIGIRNPAPGTWGIEAQPGSPAILDVAQALGRSAPTVTARVGGRARSRTLSYSATVRKGLIVTFVEEGPRVARVIGRATGRRGTLRFRPAAGPRGRRTIVAVVEQDGAPRFRRPVASYTAPGVSRPATVRRVRLRRSRTGAIVVSWSGVPRATAYAVRMRLSDGRGLFRIVSGRKRTIRVGGIPRRLRASVSVNARDASGRGGRSRRAVLRPRR